MSVKTKWCPRCCHERPLTKRYWRRSTDRADGYDAICRSCRLLVQHRRTGRPCAICGRAVRSTDHTVRTCEKPRCRVIDAAWQIQLRAEYEASQREALDQRCPKCGDELATSYNLLGEALDVCACGFSRKVPRRLGHRHKPARPDLTTAVTAGLPLFGEVAA